MLSTASISIEATASTLMIDGLSVSFGAPGAQLHAVRDVSLNVGKGEALGLIGESGSGKSTVAYAVMQHVPGDVSARSINFGDTDLLKVAPRELRRIRGRRIGMVYQDPMNALNPAFTVGSQVAEVLRHHRHLGRAVAHARVLQLFERVRLPEPARIAKRYPHQLSGGQLQRVVIAMALACEPELLIMDEPTTGLDVTTEAVILDLVAQLRRELGISLLFISHNLSVVARVCDRVAVLYAGQVVEIGTTRQILGNPRHPYTIGLLNSMPRTDVRLKRLQSIRGSIPDLRSVPEGCIFASRCDMAEDICATMPALESMGAGHFSRCHFREKTAQVRHEMVPVERPAAPDGSDATLISIDRATKWFKPDLLARILTGASAVKAVSDVSLSVQRGTTLAIVGESGSGKSTLARCVAGLVHPDGGDIRLGGSSLRSAVQRRAREQQQAIQVVFQNPDSSLNAHHTVEEIVAVLEGNQDGSSALDYTVNSASGIPFIPGEASATAPVNHALPAWDGAAGLTLAAGLLAAERHRLLSGSGELIRLALSDVALTTVANLGYLAEMEVNGVRRQPLGNYLYGAFGRDFSTRDGRLVMVVALTSRQWRALAETTRIEEAITSIAADTGLDPESEGDRFLMREEIAAALEPWFLARALGKVRNAFEGTGVCWGPYQDFGQLLQEDSRCSPDNPIFGRISHPAFGETLTPASQLRFANSADVALARAPVLGEHTDDVLRDVLGFDAARIAAARRNGLIDGFSRRF